MTTRAQLESEREVLRVVRERFLVGEYFYDALTASIARVEALLSLSDEQAVSCSARLREVAHAAIERLEQPVVDAAYWREHAAALRAVAEIVRRDPTPVFPPDMHRGDG